MKRSGFFRSIALSALMGLLAGCATTVQTRSVEPSGFLGDYSQLQEGEGDQAQLVYLDDTVDFSQYTKVMIDPIELHAVPDSKLARLDPEEQQALLDYFHASLREELSGKFVIVETAGPGVLRIRAAVTEAKGSKVVMNTVSTVVPFGLAASALKAVATGTSLAVAETQAEAEILDSETGQRLAAGVDARAGRKITLRFDKFSKYAQVKDAFDHWAQQIAQRLATAKAGAGSEA